MPSPRVSVLIPTYNYAEVLPYAIGSVLAQTFTDFELLVVGDGCSDDSEKVVRAFDDTRVRWHNLPRNTGNASGPNNEGLRHARGDVIAYLGHDDLWLPNHLGPLVQAIDRGAGLAYAIGANILPDGRHHLHPIEAFTGAMRVSPSLVVHTAEVAARAGPWRGPHELATEQDDDFFRRVLATGCTPRFVPQVSAIKFDAARRKNVYRDRPVHEQRLWTERMQKGALLELIELHENRVTTLRSRALDGESAPRIALALVRSLTRRPRAWLRRPRRARGARDFESAPYFGAHDLGTVDDAERRRLYLELYDRRRAYKGLDPLEATSKHPQETRSQ